MTTKIKIIQREIRFRKPAKTSRNTFTSRQLNYLIVTDGEGRTGIGEASPLSMLSIDDVENYTEVLTSVVDQINEGTDWTELDLDPYPSIRFGLEVAFMDLAYPGRHILSDNPFVKGSPIPINGLIWMDDLDTMRRSVDEKIKAGFDVIKLKIGAHDFDAECRLLEDIRKMHPPGSISIRLDANGAFDVDDALEKLHALSRYVIHSVEQPVKPGQWESLARICMDAKIPVALDEELIGRDVHRDGRKLLEFIKPAYVILKPNLIGGLSVADAWIKLAHSLGAGWWATSALESNIGLNAIAQWASGYRPTLPQGLGTGSLYTNNISSPLEVRNGQLNYNTRKSWEKISPGQE